MDNQFVFKIQRQTDRWVGEGGVSLDQKSADGFQRYLRNFAFQRQRFGLLYGRFVDEEDTNDDGETVKKPTVSTGTTLSGEVVIENIDDMAAKNTSTPTKRKKNQKVIVEAIYEPPQQADPSSPEGYTLLPDPLESHVETIAQNLNMRRVGWIFGHPPREDGFQRYLRNFAFQRQRFGLLYGRYVDEEEIEEEGDGKKKKPKVSRGTTLSGDVVLESIDDMARSSSDTPTQPKKRNKKVIVEAIYEPPQQPDPTSPEGYTLLDDPLEPHVETLAKHLNLRRVGWIFGHPPREDGFQLSSSEILTAAELQLEDADGVEETPFVTVKVTQGKVKEDGSGGDVSFEAFQVSRQCMAMVAEGALEVGEEPGLCYVSKTFTALQEGKESKTVENNFFLTVVPIVQHASEVFVSEFPGANREHDGREQSHGEMKRQLEKSGTAGWTFIDLLADFNLLIYLCKYLDVETDLAKICESIVDRDVPLNEGHKLIIASMAGLDGNY